jgi:hypothetical protein
MNSKRINPQKTKTIDAKIVGKDLVVQIPLEPAVLSGSGKSMVVATTRGPIASGVAYRKKQLMIVVNAFYYRKKKKRT